LISARHLPNDRRRSRVDENKPMGAPSTSRSSVVLAGRSIVGQLVKCVDVSMIDALFSLVRSFARLCVDDKHREHLNIIVAQAQEDFISYSFCSLTNCCFFERTRERSTKTPTTIIFPLVCLREKVNCWHAAFGHRIRLLNIVFVLFLR
jgi:hypothetical protein